MEGWKNGQTSNLLPFHFGNNYRNHAQDTFFLFASNLSIVGL
jgi:hypothetical protein